MYSTKQTAIIVFIIACSAIILSLSIFIIIFVRKYRYKQYTFKKELELVRSEQENAILQASLEMQEQTFKNISKEIHDNIGQKLALAKLQLINLERTKFVNMQPTVDIITNTISDLSDLSRTMSADLILANGFAHAVELEAGQLNKTGAFKLEYKAEGEIVFLDSKRELVLFRIIQEAIQNIIKHAQATAVSIFLHYTTLQLEIIVADNGKGFNENSPKGQGLTNMKARAELLGGSFQILHAEPGTIFKIIIPIHGN
jgi:two-component system NarL family sensor kinase